MSDTKSNNSVDDCTSQSSEVRRYSREQMMIFRKSAISVKRPDYLSEDFSNEDGMFQPEKWLEFRWLVEGVENRPNPNVRRKEKLRVEALEGDSTVLSPQRRGFSSGCRAASPFKNEAESERLGVNKGSWRSGAGFQLKNSGLEFKNKNPSSSNDGLHTKSRTINAAGGSSEGKWRSGDGSYKQSYHKEGGQNQKMNKSSNDEKMPEWVNDGPTSMSDMIELRGFDEDTKSEVRTKRISVSKKMTDNLIDGGFIARSSRLKEEKGRVEAVKEKANSKEAKASESGRALPEVSQSQSVQSEDTSNLPLMSSVLPNTDAEFAAFIGLLGEADLNSLKENELKSSNLNVPQATGSRLSRFFSKSDSSKQHNQNAVTSEKDVSTSAQLRTDPSTAEPSNSILNQIFSGSVPQKPIQEPVPAAVENQSIPHMQRAVRVEDLERNFQQEASRNSALMFAPTSFDQNVLKGERFSPTNRQYHPAQVKAGTPLDDPGQQAHLLNKLNKFACMQNVIPEDALQKMIDENAISSRFPVVAHQMPFAPMGIPSQAHPMTQVPHELMLQALMKSQMDNARAQCMQQQPFMANTRGMQHHPTSAGPATDNNSLSSGAVTHPQSFRPVTNIPASGAYRSATPTSVPSAFMPTSVMRHLSKKNVSVEEKLRHNSSSKQNLQPAPQFSNMKTLAGHDHSNAINKLAGEQAFGNPSNDLMAKLALQQRYVQLMQKQMGLDQWRPPPQLAVIARAQAAAAQMERQRQMAFAALRTADLGQAQKLRPRLIPQLPSAGFPMMPQVIQPQQVMPAMIPPQTGMQNTQSTRQSPSTITGNNNNSLNNAPAYKYQNPLEKLLHSAGVSSANDLQSSNIGSVSNSFVKDAKQVPSILSRLPPSANCISLEELEKQFATK